MQFLTWNDVASYWRGKKANGETLTPLELNMLASAVHNWKIEKKRREENRKQFLLNKRRRELARERVKRFRERKII